MSDNKRKNYSEGFWWIVLGIVLIILFWGLGSGSKSSGRQKISRAPKYLLEKSTQLHHRRKLQEFNKLLGSKKIALENHRKRINQIILYSRIVIGSLLMITNVIFFLFINFSDGGIRIESQVIQLMSNQLNFNEAILLFYSFFALVLYGTPRKFVAALKYQITKKMLTAHLDLSEEIKVIEKKIAEIKS